ncbi:MAG: glycosyltransferase [Candidatus Paceibacterota bacterium]
MENRPYQFLTEDKNEAKTKIIAYKADSGACWFYRLHSPLSALTRNNKSFLISVYPYMHESHMLKKNTDLAIFQRQYSAQVLQYAMQMKKDGIKIVYETDDDLFHIPDWNPAHHTYAKRQTQDVIRKFLEIADAVFTTTQPLAEELLQYNDNVYILPNSIDFRLITESPHNSIKKVAVWQGSATHKNDLKLITPAIKRLCSEDKYMVKLMYAKIEGAYSVPPVELQAFYQMMSQLDGTVGFAPIIANKFNVCKSNLKFLEYAAQKIITVASDVHPYSTSIVDGETGFIVKDNKEWYDKAVCVLENEELIEKVTSAAYEYVKDNFDIDDTYKYWETAITEVLEGKDADNQENEDDRSVASID